MEHTAFVPIVNTKGDVIGRSLAVDAINKKNEYINPVVRIAISHNVCCIFVHAPNAVFSTGGRLIYPWNVTFYMEKLWNKASSGL